MKRIFDLVLSSIVAAIIYIIFNYLFELDFINISSYLPSYLPIIVGVFIGAVFFNTLSPIVTESIISKIAFLEEKMVKMSIKELVAGVIGCIIGLGIANLIGISVMGYGIIGSLIVIFLNIIFGFLGLRVATKKKDEIHFKSEKASKVFTSGKPKILDTSAIIDGRIIDILSTGFIEGKIIIPNFVLEELRHIADSSDSLIRNRGRRGLDILNEIQKQLSVPVEIVECTSDEETEVDSKLLKMAAKTDSYVVTNDFNLNKVAEFKGVKVLNINDLANAVKPVLLPGEVMEVDIIKPGKEHSQGVAYRNDGTMVVVEGGNKYIGQTIMVVVTSALQTSAGRMIFARKIDWYFVL